ncbi:peptidase, S54 family, partial [Opisthorchis viverrini]
LCQFYSGNTSWARSKHRALQRHANVQGVLPVSGKVIGRCGLFTFVSVSALLFGSTVWSFEHWRARSWRLKHGHDGSGDRLRFSTQTLPSKRCILGYVVFGVSLNLVFSILAIVACNLVVFIGHRSPLQSIFLRYFVNSPYGRKFHEALQICQLLSRFSSTRELDLFVVPTPALSMLLSVFSHHSPFHLAINMYVLHSFTSTLINILGPGDFIYLFVGGGIFASFLSIINKSVRRSVVPSLGSSGGICAVLGAFCLLQPNAHLCVPFVVEVFPHSFQAQSAVWCLFFLELMGSIFLSARSPIDHAAHMGGLLFGMYYSGGGMDAIWKRRNTVVSQWRKWRGE